MHRSEHFLIKSGYIFFTLLIAMPAEVGGEVKLEPATAKAWDRYCQWVDARVESELADGERFLVVYFFGPAEKLDLERKLKAGEVVIRKMPSAAPPDQKFKVPDGEIHHWWGSVLVPNTKMDELLMFLKDYDNHAGKFEDVEKSSLLSKEGENYKVYFRLKRSKAFFTAHYSTVQECTYIQHGPGRVSSQSVATKIAELENAGTPEEREKPPGDDRGFLWRLVSWWRFQETPEGVVVEIESASLSRKIPLFVKFLPGLSSYIRSTPKESLESVLKSIRTHGESNGK